MGSMFNEPNALGAFAAITVVVLGSLLLTSKISFRDRILVGGSVFVTSVALVYSFSRGAWIGAATGFMVLGLLRGGKGIVALALLAMTATIWMPESVVERYEHTVRADAPPGPIDPSAGDYDSSTESRIARWKAVPGMYFSAPIVGHGYRSFSRVYGVLNEAGHATGSHSTVIQLLVEEGLLGISVYLWIMFVMFWSAFRLKSLTDDPFLRAVAMGACAATVTLGVLDLAGPFFFSDAGMAPMWLLIAGTTRQYWNLKTEGAAA